MKKLLLLFIPLMFFFGCERDEMYSPSSFPEILGEYTHYYYTSWNGGLYERSRCFHYVFDDTRKAWYYSNLWSYTESGWTNAAKESYSANVEWKIEGGVFKRRLWENEYSEWVSFDFEYIDDTSFIIDGHLYIKDYWD